MSVMARPQPAFTVFQNPIPPTLLARAFAATSLVSLITDAEQNILYVSEQFSEVTGYREADIVGVNCRILQGIGSDPSVVRAMRRALTAGLPFNGDILNFRKDGSPFWNALSVVPLRDPAGQISHFVSVQRDITTRMATPVTSPMPEQGKDPAEPGWRANGAGLTLFDASEQLVRRERSRYHRDRLFSGGLHMYMQPIVDLQTGQLSRVEALARLHLEDGRVVYPDEFLPELTLPELDELFRVGLNQSLAWLALWDSLGHEVMVSVNVGPETLLNAGCVSWVKDALARHGIDARRLELELLETQAMDHPEQRQIVDSLLALGVGFAMDDLGSGYSSLKRLSALPFRSIKLDRDLLADFHRRPVETLSVMATLHQLGRDFEVTVVAEGLEDRGMTEAAAVLGVELGQGYFLARPMPAEDVANWIAGYRHPLEVGAVVTNLGALACHWQFSRWQSLHGRAIGDCPLTGFLRRVLQPDSATDYEVRAWHAQQHTHPTQNAVSSHLAASQQLLSWLVDRVRTEHEPDTR